MHQCKDCVSLSRPVSLATSGLGESQGILRHPRPSPASPLDQPPGSLQTCAPSPSLCVLASASGPALKFCSFAGYAWYNCPQPTPQPDYTRAEKSTCILVPASWSGTSHMGSKSLVKAQLGANLLSAATLTLLPWADGSFRGPSPGRVVQWLLQGFSTSPVWIQVRSLPLPELR